MAFRNIKADLQAYKRSESVSIFDFFLALIKSYGFQVVLAYRLAFWLRHKKAGLMAGIIDRLVFHLYAAEVKSTARIAEGFNIAHPAGLVIGGKVIAGKNLSVRQCTTIGGNSGKKRNEVPEWTQPKIGDNVMVGCNSCILGPVEIASGTRIGACSLVLSDTFEGDVVGGVPAKRLSNER